MLERVNLAGNHSGSKTDEFLCQPVMVHSRLLEDTLHNLWHCHRELYKV